MGYQAAKSCLCLNLHLPWTPVHCPKEMYVWNSTSYRLPYTVQKVLYNESTPPMPPKDFTHCWLLINHSSYLFSLHFQWTSKSLYITLYVMISTSHGLPHRRSWLYLNPHLPWTPVHSAEVKKCLICTSYGLHPFLIIATSFIITSFNLHLPWTSTISPFNSVCYNLHLS